MLSGWKYTTNLEMHYNGRIWLTWRPCYFQFSVKSINAQATKIQVTNITRKKIFLLTVLYGFNRKDERKELQNYLRTESAENQLPCMIAEDCNSLLKMDNTIRGNPVTLGEVVDFHDFEETCELIEIPENGSRYTWNDRQRENKIFSKID